MLEWLANLRGIDPLAYAEKKSKWLVGWGLIKSLSKELSSRLETQDQERKRSNRK
jgi:hypothetical protein